MIRERLDPEPLSVYLDREGTTIWFEDEVFVERPGCATTCSATCRRSDLDRLVALGWDDIDVTRESQGADRDPRTVQAAAAAHLLGLGEWDVVVDDNGTGEVADLVALKHDGNRLLVHLVDCKYSSSPDTGARLRGLAIRLAIRRSWA